MKTSEISQKMGKSKISRKLFEPEYLLWENIRKKFPERFVLLENPVFKDNSPILKGGVLRYKNRSIDRVIEVANQLSLNRQTVKYTGGKLDKTEIHFLKLFKKVAINFENNQIEID